MLPHRMNEWIEIILHNDVCKQSEQVMRFFGKNKNRFKQMNERTNGWMNEQVNPRTVTPIIVHKIAIKVKLKWFTQLEFSIECIDWKVIAKLMHSKLFQDNEDFVLYCLIYFAAKYESSTKISKTPKFAPIILNCTVRWPTHSHLKFNNK